MYHRSLCFFLFFLKDWQWEILTCSLDISMTEWVCFWQFSWDSTGKKDKSKGRDSLLLFRSVEDHPTWIWRKPQLVSKLVKHRNGVNMLCFTAQPPPAHTYTHPSSTTISKHTPFQSWVNLQRSKWRELGPDFSVVEEPGGPGDTQVTNIESCSISRAQWNNSLPSGTYVKAILALQRSITLTSIKCYLFSIFIQLVLKGCCFNTC